jgi:amidase
MARTLDDIALFRAVVLALPPVAIDRASAAPRVGFCRTPIWDEAAPDTKTLLEETAFRLSAKGCKVVDVSFSSAFEQILTDHSNITAFEGARNYSDERLRNPDKVSKELMEGNVARGLACCFEAYVASQRTSDRYRLHIDSLFDNLDLLLVPSAPGEAPKGVEFTGDPRFNSLWTLAGTPCVTLPAGTGREGLPLGIQLVAKRYADDRLLSQAAWVAAHLN